MENKVELNKDVKKSKSKGGKVLRIVLVVIGIIILGVIVAGTLYISNNLNFDKKQLSKTIQAGFKEKYATLKDGTVLYYGEGPNNGPALLLIHGQGVTWEDYATVLPKLSKYYHIYAVDYVGHGKSSKNPEKYNAVAIGNDLIWFMKNVIGEPAVVSGHSCGGLLSAWLAANCPEYVRGIVLEDPPLFSTEPDRCQKTCSWVDAFKNTHDFLNQTAEKDYIIYYLKHSYWKNVFGGVWDGIVDYAIKYRAKHPNEPLKIYYLPHSMNRIWESISPTYDLWFGDTFYDCSWFKGFDQAKTLSAINCPSVLIFARHDTKIIKEYDKDGILIQAMSVEDAERGHKLIRNNELKVVTAGHDVHYEKPEEFIDIMVKFINKIS